MNARLALEYPAIPIETIFGASSSHTRQLQLGAPFDVLVSADAELVDNLKEGGWLDRDSISEIARGRLILVGRGDPHPFPPEQSQSRSQTQISDPAAIFLTKDLQRVAIPSKIVPLGRYSRAWLRGKGLLAALDGRLITTEHARATISAVEAGHVDLAFAYQSDLRLLRNARLLADLDPEEHPPIRYVAARTKRAAQCRSAQIVFLAWKQPETLRSLEAAGFSLPDPDPEVGGAGR